LKIATTALIFLSILIVASASYAADFPISISAVVLSDNNCTFRTNTASLNFGNLDPANPLDRTVSTSIQFRCGGRDPWATYNISDNDGLHSTGPDAPRMQNTADATEYLPYHIDLDPNTGTIRRSTRRNPIWGALTITGTVRGLDYQDVRMGNYRDTVRITIEP